ncbi:MAG: threonine aldolase family protein [Thermoanaerobaculia bacterium]
MPSPKSEPAVDLRSDTVTTPTAAMRRAMAEAEVGDDVYGEDPTVRALEERAAGLTGKEAALFTASGTLANQIALKVWTEAGEQVILDHRSHFLLFEPASVALISQVVPNPVPSESGWFGPEPVAERLESPAYATTGTGLVAVENTHNRAGGAVFPADALEALGRFCRGRDLPLHMDGARLFNAAAASGRSAAEVAGPVDSVMFCLSKGLGAPVGSVLCGPRDFIAEARTLRQVLGGGMRQVGVIAAPGLVSLETMVERLPEDHRRARRLAEGLAAVPGVRLDPEAVATNIVIFELDGDARLGAGELRDRLRDRGVLCLATGPRQIRMVLHHQVDEEGVARAVRAAEEILA